MNQAAETRFERLAHGQRRYLAFPGICSGDPAKVVPCHIREGAVGGMGLKPPPVCLLPGCFDCHNVLDQRVQTKLFTRDEILSMTLVGLLQWLAYLWKREYLIGVALMNSKEKSAWLWIAIFLVVCGLLAKCIPEIAYVESSNSTLEPISK